MNIVSMAMGYLGPTIVSKVAKSMGLSDGIVTKMIGMALPSILGGLTGTSRTGAGAGALFDAVSNMSWGGGNANPLEAALDVGGIGDFAQSGGGMLANLMGGDQMNGLASALSRAGGANEDQAGSLLGMLGPIALGSLRDRVDEDGMDASGLAKFLGDQTNNVAQAMPAEFAGELSGSGLFDNLGVDFGAMSSGVAAGVAGLTGAAGNAMSSATGAASGMAEQATDFARDTAGGAVDAAQGAVGSATNAAQDAAQATTGAMREAVTGAKDTVDQARSGFGILPWVIGGLVVAALAWYFLGRSPAPEVSMPDVGQNIMVGDVNIGEQFSSSLDGFKTTMSTVTDADSATAALPQIEAFGGQLDNLSGLADQLPEAAKAPFSGMIGAALEAVKPMIENVLGMAGVGDIAGPVLNGILEKLTAMAG